MKFFRTLFARLFGFFGRRPRLIVVPSRSLEPESIFAEAESLAPVGVRPSVVSPSLVVLRPGRYEMRRNGGAAGL